MLEQLIYLSTNLFSIKRWNTKPLLEFNTEASNTGFSFHIAYLLWSIEENFDISKVIKRMVLKDLPKCILADISLETKRFIQNTSPVLWQETYQSAVEELLKLISESWREEVKDCIINSKDNSIEGRIVQFCDYYSAFMECEINKRVFKEYFEENYYQIRDKIKRYEDINSISKLLKNQNYQKYLWQIRSLIHSVRWNQYNRNIKTTVAGHTFFVVLVTLIIYYISKEINNIEYDQNILLKNAAFHDVPEAITGDIISPTKKRIPGFEKIIEEVEEKMVEQNLLIYIKEDNIYKKFKENMLNPFNGKEGKIVKAADLYASLYECYLEIKTGNDSVNFKDGYKKINNYLRKMEMPEIDYLLKWSFGGID